MDTNVADDVLKLELDAALFKSVVKALAYHASTDKDRNQLTAIYFNGGCVVATDGFTLGAWRPSKPFGFDAPIGINAKELISALKDIKDGVVTLTVTGNNWTVSQSSGSSARQDGGFVVYSECPKWQPLIVADGLNTGAVFEPTGFNPVCLGNVCSASKAISKDVRLEIVAWTSPNKPMQFRTETDDGVLTQIIMPQRASGRQ